MEILCFFSGVALVCLKHAGPLFVFLLVLFFRPRLSVLYWFVAAILWTILHQWWFSDHGMPDAMLIQNADLQGYVASIPMKTSHKTQFQFEAVRLNGQATRARLLLSCYKNCPKMSVGQYWQLRAKLHRPQNLANPGAFNYVGWLSARHMYWTGAITPCFSRPVNMKRPRYPLLRLREHLADQLAKINPNEKTLGILQALALGITTHMDASEWDLFRRTGTTHLMVISGAHIGLVAGFAYWLVKWCWCRLGRCCLYYPAPKIASVVGLLMACVYALLAGFAVPAQRALIACIFIFSRNFCANRFSTWQSWRYALLAVLVFEPHSVMLPGFYLSFLAVAILVLINQRATFTGIRQAMIMQLACLVGLMPLTLYWFSYGAVNGFLANLIAIPWVGFVIVPLSLLVTVSGDWLVLPWIIGILNAAIIGLLYYLHLVDSVASVNLDVTLTHILSPLGLMVSLGVFIFMPVRNFLPAVMTLAMACILPGYNKVKHGEVRVDVLDVAQGLSVVVRTADHALVYDTGVKFYQGSDMGKLAIIPYLRTQGIHHLDKVVISHPDLDHRGGLASLEARYPVGELIVDDPNFYKRGISCHQYPDWTWDGIKFHFFPITNPLKSKNNTSCVLQISNIAGKILLCGDIEKLAEDYLTATYDTQLASDVIVVPHHGSKTSSSQPFLEKVAPNYALVSYGFDNRYHFPHRQAMDAYQQRGVPVYNTVDCGMIRVALQRLPNSIKPVCYRQ